MPNLQFQTHVSGEHGGVHYIRTVPLTELVGTSSYAATLYLMITGQRPNEAQEAMLNAILVASIDHGISPASGFVPRVVASTGNELIHAMAAGLLALGPYHGGAIGDAARVFANVATNGPSYLEEHFFARGKRLPGFGHPHYKHNDPRADQLFTLAQNLGLSHAHQTIAHSVQKAIFDRLGKHLVINVDGAIAAILLDLGFPPEAGNGLFALARAGGMIAHILEEYKEKPVRRIDEEAIAFVLPHEEQA